MSKYKVLVDGETNTTTDSIGIAAASFQVCCEKLGESVAERAVVELQMLEERKFVRVVREIGDLQQEQS